jgi:hypothetical protein
VSLGINVSVHAAIGISHRPTTPHPKKVYLYQVQGVISLRNINSFSRTPGLAFRQTARTATCCFSSGYPLLFRRTTTLYLKDTAASSLASPRIESIMSYAIWPTSYSSLPSFGEALPLLRVERQRQHIQVQYKALQLVKLRTVGIGHANTAIVDL